MSSNLNKPHPRWCKARSRSPTRQCGDPRVPAHTIQPAVTGPHLYFRYKDEGKVHSVYVPTELGQNLRDAQEAWHEFQQIGAQISADNADRLLACSSARSNRCGPSAHEAGRDNVIEPTRAQLSFAEA